MTDNEFDIIAHFFQGRQALPAAVVTGIGDDAAILDIPPDSQLVVTMDTLNAGVHFPVDTAPADIAWKTLAVNLSDLAAMGASPRYFTLSLSLPGSDTAWLEAFATSLFAAADTYDITLVGGDTTRGPLSLSVCAFGTVARGRACTRQGARAGDRIYVTGTLGDGAVGLRIALGQLEATPQTSDYLLQRLRRPIPRVAIGVGAASYVSAMIDISDGLAADLGHILTASAVGAELAVAQLPLSAQACATVSHDEVVMLALTGGDDYELCMTVPQTQVSAFEARARQRGWPLTCVGMITEQPGLRVIRTDGSELVLGRRGYQHFSVNDTTEQSS